MTDCEHCGRCQTCPETCCVQDERRPNTCLHGLHICQDCAPGNCDECAATKTEEEPDVA